MEAATDRTARAAKETGTPAPKDAKTATEPSGAGSQTKKTKGRKGWSFPDLPYFYWKCSLTDFYNRCSWKKSKERSRKAADRKEADCKDRNHPKEDPKEGERKGEGEGEGEKMKGEAY